MGNQLKPTQSRIAALAEIERGDRTREEQFGDEAQIAFNSYATFAAGKSWPRARTLRRIEVVLGWPSGIIDAVLSAGLDPSEIQLEHMRGSRPLTRHESLGDYTDAELLEELRRRAEVRSDAENGC